METVCSGLKEKEILPENINIYLVDNSKAMINAARKLILNEKDYYEKKKEVIRFIRGFYV